MAYDEHLTERFGKALGLMDGVSDQKMMGGICFMHHGNMIGGASRDKNGIGWFMFRVGKDNHEAALSRKGGRELDFTGRKMAGMIKVFEDECDDQQLADWINLAMSFVSTLPPKPEKKKAG